jgi:hypothetical protein
MELGWKKKNALVAKVKRCGQCKLEMPLFFVNFAAHSQ